MTQAEQFKLVADILNTAEPGSKERFALVHKLKTLHDTSLALHSSLQSGGLQKVDSNAVRDHLNALLDFQNSINEAA